MSTIAQPLIDESLARPDSFMWSGDEKYFQTWGLCGPVLVENSGEVLNRSNYEVIRDDLQERFPGEVEEIPCNHWAVGPITQLGVHVIDEHGEPTPVFKALVDWRENLQAYPVADEEHYSKLQHSDLIDYIHKAGSWAFEGDWEWADELPEGYEEKIAEWLFDHYSVSSYEDLPSDHCIGEAAIVLGFAQEES